MKCISVCNRLDIGEQLYALDCRIRDIDLKENCKIAALLLLVMILVREHIAYLLIMKTNFRYTIVYNFK